MARTLCVCGVENRLDALGNFSNVHVPAATYLPDFWRLAVLKRQLGDWDHIQGQRAACDADLQALLQQVPSAEARPQQPLPPADAAAGKGKRKGRKNGKSSKNELNFNLEVELRRVAGVDLSRIDGIKAMTIQTVISEAGLDRSKWASEDHFVSWIGLSPRNEVSGGRC